MERRPLGKTGMNVSVLGFGGAEIGFEGASLETVEKLLSAAFDAGLNAVDTAECYEESEELIGRAVAHRRQDFFLFTKCGHASGIDLPDWDLKLLEMQVDRSLKRLRTEVIDLIELHSCSEDLLREGGVISVLQKARDSGKTRFIGYSGDNQAAAYAVECGAFDVLQTSVNIADQSIITETLPKAKAAGMGVIAKRPIANVAWRTGEKEPDNAYHRAYWERLRKLDYPFLGGERAVEIALRFTLTAPGVCTAIVGTKNPDRWVQNAALLAGGASLAAEDYEDIRARWLDAAETGWVGQG
jgi:hypothetical protein